MIHLFIEGSTMRLESGVADGGAPRRVGQVLKDGVRASPGGRAIRGRPQTRQHRGAPSDEVGRYKILDRRDERVQLRLSYLDHCNKHDFDAMATFYAPTINIDGVPMDPDAVTAKFAKGWDLLDTDAVLRQIKEGEASE